MLEWHSFITLKFLLQAKCEGAILQERNVHENKDALLNLKQACHVGDLVYLHPMHGCMLE